MSRNSSGTYTLPVGNPVVTGTTITSSWANTTLSDIGDALTDSLSRTGQGSMQAGLPLADGTASLPGLAWGTELTSGLYRAASNDYRWVNSTTELLQLTTNILRVSGSAPNVRLNETDAAANNRLWAFRINGEQFLGSVYDDAASSVTNWLTIDRTANTVDIVNIASTALRWNGVSMVNLDSSPTWTGDHTFTGADDVIQLTRAGNTFIAYQDTSASANTQRWAAGIVSGAFVIRAQSDAGAGIENALALTHDAGNVLTMTLESDLITLSGPMRNDVQGSAASPSFQIGSSLPLFALFESDAAANNGLWTFRASGETLSFAAANDAGSVQTNWLTVDRNGTTVDTVALLATTLAFTGAVSTPNLAATEVGFKGLPPITTSANYTFTLADAASVAIHNSGGGAGDTFTIPANASVAFPVGTVLNFANRDTNSVSIAITSDTMYLAGTTTTGTRTLAENGFATAVKVTSTIWIIDGSGLS